MPRYAKDQPAGFTNTIERVAIVGAGGTIGTHITTALLATGLHTITALTRPTSTTKLPPGIHIAPVDYTDESTLIAALQGHQFLIITLAPTAPRDTHSKLVHAAAKAGIPYIMPNSYAGDIDNVKLNEDTLLGPVAQAQRAEIEALGMQWVALCCGFWYEYSLAGGETRFGFDFARRRVTMYDEGRSVISTTTLKQVGRAVARVLSLKVLPEDEFDGGLALEGFLGKGVYVRSFVLTQRDMFESVLRVSGTRESEWVVVKEESKMRYRDGLALVKRGNMAGFSKLLYARAFWPEDSADLSGKAQNEVLGLPEEELDEATRAGIELVEELQLRVERMAA
ncbi:aromatic alcohol reductase [Aspergillus ibericus CBS 121593]|uniref:NAD(P)-binding protein n=1 Tax=Aspergillus ibericus CBS 121593 TaxID=1448316 RepID=A0A395GY08_9EURO|nr:NAD(P)-binding protein [Aspergillus ibericus CBS 121593]RAK99964.1 NAD(P)-binding protein [Aspergillus ibericus CBS 121593]